MAPAASVGERAGTSAGKLMGEYQGLFPNQRQTRDRPETGQRQTREDQKQALPCPLQLLPAVRCGPAPRTHAAFVSKSGSVGCQSVPRGLAGRAAVHAYMQLLTRSNQMSLTDTSCSAHLSMCRDLTANKHAVESVGRCPSQAPKRLSKAPDSAAKKLGFC